jgi:hypothetical protein
VQLPAHVGSPLEVYVNGVPQRRGVDYEQAGAELLFARELASEGKLGFWRWASMLLGIAGTYRQNDTVDVVYDAAGQRRVESGLPFEPLEAPEP